LIEVFASDSDVVIRCDLSIRQDAELGILRAILGSRPLSPGGVGTAGAVSPAAAGTPGANFSTVRPLPKKVIKGLYRGFGVCDVFCV
jgi:hypothetical protein